MSVPSKLTMTCKITPVTGQDTGAEKIYGGQLSDVKCFAFGNTKRFKNKDGHEYIPEFQILFLPTADVGIDYLVDEVRSHKGELVFKSGIIISVDQNFHPKKGLVLKSVYTSKR